MRKILVSLAFVLGISSAIAQEMSLMQAFLIIGRDVIVKQCPAYVAIADNAKHAAELAYVKSVLTADAGDNSYEAVRARMESTPPTAAFCKREVEKVKHPAASMKTYTYTNLKFLK